MASPADEGVLPGSSTIARIAWQDILLQVQAALALRPQFEIGIATRKAFIAADLRLSTWIDDGLRPIRGMPQPCWCATTDSTSTLRRCDAAWRFGPISSSPET